MVVPDWIMKDKLVIPFRFVSGECESMVQLKDIVTYYASYHQHVDFGR